MPKIKKNIKASRSNGEKGGRPKKQNAQKTSSKKSEAELLYEEKQAKLQVLEMCHYCRRYFRRQDMGVHRGVCPEFGKIYINGVYY